MIVKVQLSHYPRGSMLVYDQRRRVEFAGPTSPEVAAVMGERHRAFFHAEVVDGKLVLGKEVIRGW